VLADVERPALADAVSKLEGAGHEVLGVPADVSRFEDLERLAERAIEAYGKVHVVHNNAGVVRAGRLGELTLADWEWVLGVDLWSVIFGVKTFLPLIKDAGEGHIVCGNCRNCRAGRHHLCRRTSGVGVNRDGAFADFIVLPASNVYPLPDALPDDVAAILDPLGNAVHTALSFDLVGEDVLITGAGPIGQMAVAICRHAGARHIVVTDVRPARLTQAEALADLLPHFRRHRQRQLSRRVAGGEVQQQEDDQRDEDQGRDGHQQSPDRESQHVRPLALLPAGRVG